VLFCALHLYVAMRSHRLSALIIWLIARPIKRAANLHMDTHTQTHVVSTQKRFVVQMVSTVVKVGTHVEPQGAP